MNIVCPQTGVRNPRCPESCRSTVAISHIRGMVTANRLVLATHIRIREPSRIRRGFVLTWSLAPNYNCCVWLEPVQRRCKRVDVGRQVGERVSRGAGPIYVVDPDDP